MNQSRRNHLAAKPANRRCFCYREPFFSTAQPTRPRAVLTSLIAASSVIAAFEFLLDASPPTAVLLPFLLLLLQLRGGRSTATAVRRPGAAWPVCRCRVPVVERHGPRRLQLAGPVARPQRRGLPHGDRRHRLAGRPAGTATGITSRAAAKPRLPAGSPPLQPQIAPQTPPPDANPRSRLAKHLPKTAGEKNTEKKLPISRAAPPGRATPEMASAAPLARPPPGSGTRIARPRLPASTSQLPSRTLLLCLAPLPVPVSVAGREREGRKEAAGWVGRNNNNLIMELRWPANFVGGRFKNV